MQVPQLKAVQNPELGRGVVLSERYMLEDEAIVTLNSCKAALAQVDFSIASGSNANGCASLTVFQGAEELLRVEADQLRPDESIHHRLYVSIAAGRNPIRFFNAQRRPLLITFNRLRWIAQ